MHLRKATAVELDAVSALYTASIGTPGCPWNENYPTMDEASRDWAAGRLYVMTDGGEIVGAASVEPENELDDLSVWSVNDGSHREIARVVVSPAQRGKGYAAQMLTLLFDELKSVGVRSIHLLVAKTNPAAVNTYKRLGFRFIGEEQRYETDFYVCEKLL